MHIRCGYAGFLGDLHRGMFAITGKHVDVDLQCLELGDGLHGIRTQLVGDRDGPDRSIIHHHTARGDGISNDLDGHLLHDTRDAMARMSLEVGGGGRMSTPSSAAC